MPRPSNYRARRNVMPPPARTKPEGAEDCPNCKGWLLWVIERDRNVCTSCDYEGELQSSDTPPPPYPEHWVKGQLLNVRNNGSNYIVTVLKEEFDPQRPERAKFFDNSFDAQEFISNWYNREAADPRA